jgi:hypothetical protein
MAGFITYGLAPRQDRTHQRQGRHRRPIRASFEKPLDDGGKAGIVLDPASPGHPLRELPTRPDDSASRAWADSQMIRQNSDQRSSIHQTLTFRDASQRPNLVHHVHGPRAWLAHSMDARDPGTESAQSTGQRLSARRADVPCQHRGDPGGFHPPNIPSICMSGYVNGPNLGASALLSKLPRSMCTGAEGTKGP